MFFHYFVYPPDALSLYRSDVLNGLVLRFLSRRVDLRRDTQVRSHPLNERFETQTQPVIQPQISEAISQLAKLIVQHPYSRIKEHAIDRIPLLFHDLPEQGAGKPVIIAPRKFFKVQDKFVGAA